MLNQICTLVLGVGIYLAIPIALAIMIEATWAQILIAYALLLLLLGSFVSGGGSLDEKIGWIFILGMFVTIPAIPIFSLLLRVLGIATRSPETM